MKKSIQVTWLCSWADIYSVYPPSASITASIRIPNWEHAFFTSTDGSSANTQGMAAIRLTLVLWEVMLVMFSTYDQIKQIWNHVVFSRATILSFHPAFKHNIVSGSPGVTIQGQSRLWCNSNEGVLHIPQTSSITEASLSDCFAS